MMLADIDSSLKAALALTMTPTFVAGTSRSAAWDSLCPYLECVSKTVTAVTITVTFGIG